ncbi:MAG: efflux transporter outer membrane subunit [Steroidobacterales bacterium]
MRFARAGVPWLFALAMLCACTLEPRYAAPPLPVADAWPIPATTATGPQAASGAVPPAAAAPAAGDIGWRDFFVDARLQALIAQALANNRDLRIAVINVERARALYRIQRANQLPTIDASGTVTKEKLPAALSLGQPSAIYQYYQAGLGLAAFEVDLFGRVRSLSHAALEQYLAQQETRRGAQLSLIAAVADAYLTLASDRDLQHLAAGTLESQRASFELTRQRHSTGSASGLDLAQARTTVESARADAARYDGNVAQDIDALTLLLGAAADPAMLPEALDAQAASIAVPPPGLPSSVLLRRPDVLAAEHQLRSANANIGAARAAFFPTISLSGNLGSASDQLSGLFKGGTGAWTFTPQVTLPIFAGGRNFGGLAEANADQRIALSAYEKAIQAGFRDVADALALSASLANEREADEALAQATAVAFELAQQRYKAGRDSYLNVLDAQRSDYAARQRLIAVRLGEQSNRITLYTALGGGWLERSLVR